MRVIDVRQESGVLSWRSTLFERCSNERPPMQIALIEPVPQPVCTEVSWEEWDDAVLHQDRRMGVLA